MAFAYNFVYLNGIDYTSLTDWLISPTTRGSHVLHPANPGKIKRKSSEKLLHGSKLVEIIPIREPP